ncbi:MAG: sodium:proton antiporter [Erythrobacter sp.]|uniref:cation:proton antiporter n=1 Tax=Erythrobacter sp. TaxID=1042 RepID=UPI003C75D2FA
MDPRIVFIAAFGLALMAAVGLEKVLSKFWLSLPIVYVAIGWALFQLPFDFPSLNPAQDGFDAIALEYITEFIVIASLAAAGIAIDRPVSWRNWRQIAPLLIISMPLTIAAVAFLGWWGLGLSAASAILLGAVLAPTDPVLARSVQVGPPGESKRHDVRFSLTVEAGMNDGLAFPFTYLAIAAIGMASLGAWTLEWFAIDLVWRILAGTAVGWAVGRAGAWYVFERGEGDAKDADRPENPGYSTSEGLVVLGTLLSAYGLAEIVEGYGFIAVFVGAVTARQREARSRYHRITHHFIDQIEQIVLVLVLLAFGAMLASGVLEALTWPAALIGLALVLVIRPVAGLLGEWKSPLPWPGTLAIAFLGVRGMGSIYYLAYGQNHGTFAPLDLLWATVTFTILVSIVVHGISAGPIIRWAERRAGHVHTGEDEDMAGLAPGPGPGREKAAEA